ncbi:MAG: cytochrome c [Terriglobales bacterium]
MRNLIIGIILGVVGLAAGLYAYLHFGFVDLRASQPVSPVERFYMGEAVDKYVERHAPQVQNPVQPTDENLIAGVRIYKSNCAVCHGGPRQPVSEIGRALYPRAPQFLEHSPHMPDNQTYWITRHGIARSGMPAWEKALSDRDIWLVTTFLSHMSNLENSSAAVLEEWKTGGPAELGAQQGSPPAKPAMPKPQQHGAHDHQHDHEH